MRGGEGGGWSDGDDSRAEFYAYGDVVVGGEAAFAEADCELGFFFFPRGRKRRVSYVVVIVEEGSDDF